MFQDFIIKKMLKQQGVPDAQVEMFLSIFKKNPKLFKQIAEEVKARVEKGEDQQTAAMGVMKAHEAELKQAMEK